MTEARGSRGRLSLGEAIAALGVIGSLIFVGLEIRQNTAATEGATLQAISDMHTALLLEGGSDPAFMELFNRVLIRGHVRADFRTEETLRLNRYYIAFLSHLENTYLQYRAGLVSEDVFESYGWRNLLWITPHFLEISDDMLRVAVSPEFAEFFRDRTAELGPYEIPTGWGVHMDPEELRALGAEYTAAWNRLDPASVASFHDESSFLKVNDAEPAVGRDAIAEVARGFMTAFPDMVLEMDSIVETPTGARYHWTYSGTNTGPGGTGMAVRFSGYEEWTLGEDGLIRGALGHFDEAEYERQLRLGVDAVGAEPEPGRE
ncbi:MAG: ester cyclase [Acidobacteriota bacterium]|nr:ester cyclase [Acidobacteriota bacterium]